MHPDFRTDGWRWGLLVAAAGRATRARRPEQFRDILTAPWPTACAVPAHGGHAERRLDSSSVACVAAPLSQRPGRACHLFAVFDQTPQWSERPFIEAVLEAANSTR